MHLKFLYRSLIALGVAIFATAPSAQASCGIAWRVPTNHFDGINQAGEFSYWREAGQIDFGDNFKIPLTIGFKPNRGGISCLGKGWIVPLLESNIVQIDELRFLATQPDGLTRQFWRMKPTDTILLGQGGWKGEIKPNTITLWSECGTKLEFFKGKIVTISTPRDKKDRVLNVLYINGVASEIQEKGKTALKLERDLRGVLKGFKFGDKRVEIAMGERPRVDAMAGNNVVAGSEPSVHMLTLSDGKQASYDFGVNEKLQPTLNISGDAAQSFTWNPVTGYLLRDGEWSYDIRPGKDRWAHAAIGRINAQKQKEYWFDDKVNGVITTEGIDKIRNVTYLFTSGALRGKIRKQEKIFNGRTEIDHQFFYDEEGRLIRKITQKKSNIDDVLRIVSFVVISYENFDPLLSASLRNSIARAEKVMVSSNNDLSAWRYYDKHNHLIGEMDSASNLKEYIFDTEKREIAWLANGIQGMAFLYAGNSDKPIKRIEYAEDGQKILRENEYSYDSENKLIGEKIICHELGITNQLVYMYNLQGDLIKMKSNLTGEYLINNKTNKTGEK